MHQASPTFSVEEFEYVEAGPELALLRLAGRWRAGDPPLDVSLVAVSGDERLTLSPLPAPPAGDGAWRAAYSAAPALLSDPDATFELEPPAGRPIPLPQPVPHGSGLALEPAREPAVEPVFKQKPPAPERGRHDIVVVSAQPERPAGRIFGRRRQPPQPESHIALRDALSAEHHARQAAERTAAEERARAQHAEALLADDLRSTVGKTEELITKIDGYEHSRISFEEELDAVRRTHAALLAETEDEHRKELRALRQQVHDLQRELSVVQDELDSANHHVDTLNDAHSMELGKTRSQRDIAEEQLAEARADADGLRTKLGERDELIERVRAEAAQAGEETAELEVAINRLRDAIAARVRDAATAGAARRFARDPEAIDRSREELRRDAERIAALERQAEALRDAIHSQLPYSLHASPLQEALPVAEPEEEKTQVDA